MKIHIHRSVHVTRASGSTVSPLYCVNYSSVTLLRPWGMLQEKYSSQETRLLAVYTLQQVRQKEAIFQVLSWPFVIK